SQGGPGFLLEFLRDITGRLRQIAHVPHATLDDEFATEKFPDRFRLGRRLNDDQLLSPSDILDLLFCRFRRQLPPSLRHFSSVSWVVKRATLYNMSGPRGKGITKK